MLGSAIQTSLLAFLPTMGPMELLIVGAIAVLLFGKRLPEVARSVGKSFVEFKKGMRGIEDEVNQVKYAPPPSSSYNYEPMNEHEEATAPKFEPPTAEPQAETDQPSETAEAAETKEA